MLPLEGVRVAELTDGRGESCGRFLADLGAEVVLVEPPGGSRTRRDDHVRFAATSANKSSVVIDLGDDAGRAALRELLAGADIWIDGTDPGTLEEVGLGPEEVHRAFPHLVVVSITEFGHSGPYRDWVASDWVHLALTPALSRSGVPDRPPIAPPGDMSSQMVGAQAAWSALLAYWHRLETGAGDWLDMSVFECTAQVLDPSTGSIGTAAAAQLAMGLGRGRPLGRSYPIFPCADGFVRTVILAPKQWRGMFEWLGEPEELADPKYAQMHIRFAAADQIYPLISELFHDKTMVELVTEGQRRSVPIAPVVPASEVPEIEHFRARGTFVDVDVDGRKGKLAAGYVLIDGERCGVRRPAPELGAAAPEWSAREPGADATGQPLDGLRVLDLGVIVMGAEAGRLFADQGADVVKVENSETPDGARTAGMTPHFASGQRNKRSMGVNLRNPDGHAVFERLVAEADVVLTNFKPGTVETLGIDYEHLAAINPGIVLVTSSAMGEWGPWRDWMGYGPLVRCVSGLTSLWRDPGVEDGFGDATTIYPDHMVGRVVDAAALAVLVARRRTGRGAHVESSQAEAIITGLAETYLRATLGDDVDERRGAPWGIYPCAGDDEWCVITVRTDDEWERLVEVLGRPSWTQDPAFATADGRIAARAELDLNLAEWTAARAPREVGETLQTVRVPAAPMQRVEEYLRDPQLAARGFFRSLTQPGIDDPVTTENAPAVARRMPAPPLRAAPSHGEHTWAIARDLLGMSDAEIEQLLADGALQSDAAT